MNCEANFKRQRQFGKCNDNEMDERDFKSSTEDEHLESEDRRKLKILTTTEPGMNNKVMITDDSVGGNALIEFFLNRRLD